MPGKTTIVRHANIQLILLHILLLNNGVSGLGHGFIV